MRSDLIFGALTHVNNRYQLCQLVAKATRKLHKPNTRLQDTTNEVLDRFKDTVPMNDQRRSGSCSIVNFEQGRELDVISVQELSAQPKRLRDFAAIAVLLPQQSPTAYNPL